MSENLNVFLKIHATSYSKFIAFDYLLNKQNLFTEADLCVPLKIIRIYIGREKKIQKIHYRNINVMLQCT